ncbi:MAG: hypothetical protein FJ148_19280 [Deltaproteobacteria bacterium]|nr:hypothetical protein [Deltaproteobacteria bacterium]
MRQVALHFTLGAVVSGALAALFALLRGERVGSLVLLPVVVGIVCASAAHVVGPWATLAVLTLIAATIWHEYRSA